MTRRVPSLNEDSVRNEGHCLSKFIEFGKAQLERREKLVKELAARDLDLEKVLQLSKLEDEQRSCLFETQPLKKKASGRKSKQVHRDETT